ncbi:MAG: hypothetical protein ACRCVT_11865, partial [Leadbetterella sp.]
YTVADNDYTLILNPTAAINIALPLASNSRGRILNLVNIGTVTSNLVNGGTLGTVITSGSRLQIISDGTNWIKIN